MASGGRPPGGRRQQREDSDSDRDLQEQSPKDMHGPPATNKSWFIPDEDIVSLVSRLAQTNTFGTSESSSWASPRRHRQEGVQTASNALERAIRMREESAAAAASTPPSLTKKSWKVSDDKVKEFVASLSQAPAPMTPRHGTGTLGLAGSETVRSARHGEKMDVWIFFQDSEDAMRLAVSPWLRMGPDKAEPDALGASMGTSYSSTPRSRSSWRDSLKGMIEELAGIEMDRLKLYLGATQLLGDHRHLKFLGIAHGDTICVRINKNVPGSDEESQVRSWKDRHLVLACAQKAALAVDKQRGNKYERWTLENSKYLKHCRNISGDVYMQLKWTFQKVSRKRQDGDTVPMFKLDKGHMEQPIYVNDPENAAMRHVRIKFGLI